MPILYIFSGLPGTGKTSISRGLAQSKSAFHLRIDTVEQALRDLCHIDVEGEGYRLAYRIAADNLKLGLSVVADSCNTIPLTRREWESVATTNNATFVNIEIVCSDIAKHRQRVESRTSDIAGLSSPTWQSVIAREYSPWQTHRIVIDTAVDSVEESVQTLIRLLDDTTNAS